jgi:hypothetical protein
MKKNLLLVALVCSSVGVAAHAGTLTTLRIKENIEMTEQNTDDRVKIENPSGAPLIFTDVVIKPYQREGSDKVLVSFNLTVKNQTSKRITRFAFTQKSKSGPELHAVQQIAVEPNGTQTFLVQIMPKEPSNLTVTMTGVQFEDGTQWGTVEGLPGGKDGLLGKPQSSMLNPSSQTTLTGKVQGGTFLQGTQPNSLFDTSKKDNLFGKTQGSMLKTQP